MAATVPYVAIVDDEEPVRKALKRLLRASGLEAETYASGRDFLDASELRRPDCVILDLHMPDMSGFQVLNEMRAAHKMLPTVVITAYDEPGAREQCLAAGAAAYLRKPLEEKLLLNAISANAKINPKGNHR
jgi:FixJ family two-component response regulator